MTLQPALARLGRGFRRMWAWTVQTVTRRPAPTRGQLEQERETSVSLGLMAQAAAAGPEMSPEQQIFLSQSEHGMRERLSVLLHIPHRSLAQEREKVAIEAWLTRDAPPPAPARIRGFLGPVAAANPLLGVLSSPVVWVAAAFAIPAAWGSVTTWRLNHAKADLRDTREALEQAVSERDAWHERAEAYAQAVTDAREVARQSAVALDAERARRARAAAAERRRQREIQDVLIGSTEPPAWRLRDDEPVSSGPGPSD